MKNKVTKYEAFLKGKYVDLANISLSFLRDHSWHTWLNDQKITKLTKQGYFPLSKAEHLKFVKNAILSRKRLQLGIIKKTSNFVIGMISLYNINQTDQCCSVSALMNMHSKEIDSIKYLIEAQTLIINHAFKKLNLKRVEAAANDKKLCKMNEKLFGFKCEGVMKERDYIDGVFKDRFILAILRKDWDNKKNN